MLEGLLRVLSIGCSIVVVLGFALFAIDEVRAASDDSAAQVAGRVAAYSPSPYPEQEGEREAAHNGARELVDDVNDLLLSPFTGIAGGDQWVERGVPALLALLVYGFGLGFLARFATGRG